MVPVAPGNLLSRQVIRRTWGKEGVVLGRAVRVLFLLGMPGGAGVERQQEQLKVEDCGWCVTCVTVDVDGYPVEDGGAGPVLQIPSISEYNGILR